MAETDAVKTALWIQWLDLDTEFGEDESVQSTLQRPNAEQSISDGHVNVRIGYGVVEVADGAAVLG
jgi:hypothetical protein